MSEKFIGTLMVEGVYDLGHSHMGNGRRCRTGENFVFSADEVEHIQRDPFERFKFEPYDGSRPVGYKFEVGEPHHVPAEPVAEPQAEPASEETDALAPA